MAELNHGFSVLERKSNRTQYEDVVEVEKIGARTPLIHMLVCVSSGISTSLIITYGFSTVIKIY